jgi:hypothetical protein
MIFRMYNCKITDQPVSFKGRWVRVWVQPVSVDKKTFVV